VEAVASGDEVAVEALAGTVVLEGEVRRGGVEGVERDAGGFEENGAIGGQAGRD
jgi:hypothetical protein